MEQHPLLTKNQLIDWLIYHCPLQENTGCVTGDESPFIAFYRSQLDVFRWSSYCICNTPWGVYERLANSILNEPIVHREITDLYWYWTI